MARELERAVVALVRRVLSADVDLTPAWLQRPGPLECGRRWSFVCSVYRDLTDLELPDTMPPRERRDVDAVLITGTGEKQILEFDETQHFNRYRALTLRRYSDDVNVSFPVDRWIQRCDAKTRLEGGGFGRPKPPLFPAAYGRHAQRAFRDMLADVLPQEHGWKPTLRIAYFEVIQWIYSDEAEARMRDLLACR